MTVSWPSFLAAATRSSSGAAKPVDGIRARPASTVVADRKERSVMVFPRLPVEHGRDETSAPRLVRMTPSGKGIMTTSEALSYGKIVWNEKGSAPHSLGFRCGVLPQGRVCNEPYLDADGRSRAIV